MTPMPARSARDASTVRPGFGYKAQVTDNDDAIILDYNVEYGAALDGPQLAPAAPAVCRGVTDDRGYGQATVECDLHELGVRTVAIPRQATTSAAARNSSTAPDSTSWSNGAPVRRDASATSSEATGGTAPA